MMHLKPNKNGIANVTDFTDFVSVKHNGVINLAKIVVIISVLFAALMIISK